MQEKDSKAEKVRTEMRSQLIEMLDDEEFDMHRLYEALRVRGQIAVYNKEPETIWVKVSKACGAGQDGYWEIPPGGRETWMRCVYHRVTMKASRLAHDDAGIFADVDHTTAVSTNCNVYWVEEGRFIYQGPPDCL